MGSGGLGNMGVNGLGGLGANMGAASYSDMQLGHPMGAMNGFGSQAMSSSQPLNPQGMGNAYAMQGFSNMSGMGGLGGMNGMNGMN
jgi:hypothetical protein